MPAMSIDASPASGALEPIAVSAREAARLVGVGRSHFLSLVDQGRAPKPSRIGRRCVWPVAALRQWVEDGCPPRPE